MPPPESPRRSRISPPTKASEAPGRSARTLVHLSDVHFGPKHDPAAAAAARAFVASRRPDVVVVSGDLTQRAKPAQFAAARAWIDTLPGPRVVVPGNHDVPLYRVWERALAPFGAWRRHFSPDLETEFADERLIVLGVNSAFNWTFKGGHLRRRRIDEVQARFAAAGPGAFKVVVVHHPLGPAPEEPREPVARRARRALGSFSAAGADLVLAGHLHHSFLIDSSTLLAAEHREILLLHVGTTTSTRGRGRERGANTFAWIAVERDHVAIDLMRFDRAAGEFRLDRRWEVPRLPTR